MFVIERTLVCSKNMVKLLFFHNICIKEVYNSPAVFPCFLPTKIITKRRYDDASMSCFFFKLVAALRTAVTGSETSYPHN